MNITREQVERIATDGPWNNQTKNSLGNRVCYHCDFVEPNHAEDCVWVLARALLAADDALKHAVYQVLAIRTYGNTLTKRQKGVLESCLADLMAARLPREEGQGG